MRAGSEKLGDTETVFPTRQMNGASADRGQEKVASSTRRRRVSRDPADLTTVGPSPSSSPWSPGTRCLPSMIDGTTAQESTALTEGEIGGTSESLEPTRVSGKDPGDRLLLAASFLDTATGSATSHEKPIATRRSLARGSSVTRGQQGNRARGQEERRASDRDRRSKAARCRLTAEYAELDVASCAQRLSVNRIGVGSAWITSERSGKERRGKERKGCFSVSLFVAILAHVGS